jgi:RHS repeat-associated protein
LDSDGATLADGHLLGENLMRLARIVSTICLFLHLSQVCVAQNKPAQCSVTCEPDSTSGSYASTYTARPLSNNVRASGSVLAPLAAVTSNSSSPATALPGSQSYSYAIPIVSLPGRNGLDVNLALLYNSAPWTLDSAGSRGITFNADRDFPSYGFRLGYGLVEAQPTGSSSLILTEPNGTKRGLVFSSGTTYVTTDSSYIDWNSTTSVLRRKDGTQWIYQRVGTTVFYRPIKILDTNGNFISIVYSATAGADKQAIATITDTIGRVITFNYDSSSAPKLVNITVTPPGGAAKTVAYFNWGSIPFNYNFGLPVHDSVPSGTMVNALTSCAYPNATGTAPGPSYSFTYGDWGIVDKISRLSANGVVRSYVRYDYPTVAASPSGRPTYQHQFVSADGINESSSAHAVSMVGDLTTSFAVTDSFGTTATTNLNTTGWQIGLVSSVAVANGATTYSTVNYVWTQDNPSQTSTTNPRLSSTTTVNDAGQSAISYQYDSNGNVSDIFQNGYGAGARRETLMAYLTGTSYATAHILDRLTKIQIFDSSGVLKGRTDIAYDSYGSGPASVTGAPQHDDTNYGTGFSTRGNVTSTTRYTNAAAATGAVTRNLTYDILGNLLTAQLDCCQQKQWVFTSTTGYAYPDSITRGSGTTLLTTSTTYNLVNGLAASQTDENGQVVNFLYDALSRPTSVTAPLSSSVTYSYDDNSSQPAGTQTTAIDAGKTLVQITTSDGLGRAVKQETKDGAGQNSSIVDTQYDSLGRVSQVSNPHAPGVTPGQTVTQYDAVGRALKIIPPDGSTTSNNTQFLYLGNAVTVTDPAGKQRRSFTNALGQLVQVDEPGPGAATPGIGSVSITGTLLTGCNPSEPIPSPPGHCHMITDTGSVSVTVGSFSASVNFSGFQNKTASAIAIALSSKLNASGSPVSTSVSGSTISITAVQSGDTTNYPLSVGGSSTFGSFTANPSGAALSGGTNAATENAPSLGHPLQTVYTYDGLDNLTNVTQGVQQRQFIYDSLGQLTSATTPEAGTVSYTYGSFTGLVATRTDARNVVTNYSYDGLNRLYQVSYNVGTSGVPATPTTTLTYGSNASQNNKGRLITMTDGVGSENYSYDVLGRTTQLSKTINSLTYPISYAYDTAGNLKQITYPSGRIVQQATDSLGRLTQVSSAGTNYVTGIAYNPAWEPTGFNYGNGVQASFSYNARMQLASLGYTKSGTNLLGLAYSYVAPNGGNNGQIAGITDSVDSTRSTTFTYDAWSRLKQASNSQWTVTETYDRFGNRSAQSPPVMNSVLVDPNTNRLLSSYAYDAAGNMTNDGSNTLVYDAENRAVSAANGGNSGTYTYDGKGLRVKKVSGGTTTVYIFAGSKVIAEYQNGAAVASPAREYIYMGGQVAATLSGGATTYHHPDELSTRVSTDSSGNTVRTFGHFPFGETWYETGTASKLKFTSYERDSESGNDYAMARSYVNRLGRFSSPDPLGGTIGDPQSLNRYAYVQNDPVDLIDPLGLWCVWEDGTHDDKPELGGIDSAGCLSAGGHWDPYNTITGIFQQDGVVTQINTIYGNYSGYGQTLEGFDQTLQSYVQSPDNRGNNSWAWTFTKTFASNLVSKPFWTTAFKPGTCGGVFLDAIQGPLQGTMKAARTIQQNAAGIQGISIAVTNSVGSIDANSMFTSVMNADGETTTAVLTTNAVVSIGAANVTRAVAGAVPKVPTAALAATDAILFYGVAKEASGALNGTCHE